MGKKDLLVAGASISKELAKRLDSELAKDPQAIERMRKIAARALEQGRIEDAYLAGAEANYMARPRKQTG